jgi:hypothetical protein
MSEPEKTNRSIGNSGIEAATWLTVIAAVLYLFGLCALSGLSPIMKGRALSESVQEVMVAGVYAVTFPVLEFGETWWGLLFLLFWGIRTIVRGDAFDRRTYAFMGTIVYSLLILAASRAVVNERIAECRAFYDDELGDPPAQILRIRYEAADNIAEIEGIRLGDCVYTSSHRIVYIPHERITEISRSSQLVDDDQKASDSPAAVPHDADSQASGRSDRSAGIAR